MKGSFTDGFLFYRIASFMDFTYSATYGTRDIAFFFYQIYHRADIGRDLTPDAGATLIHGVTPCALRDTCISPATNVCPTSQRNISSFWLRPQRSIWQSASRPSSQPPGLSVRAYAALISASTVLVCLNFHQYTTHGVKC